MSSSMERIIPYIMEKYQADELLLGRVPGVESGLSFFFLRNIMQVHGFNAKKI